MSACVGQCSRGSCSLLSPVLSGVESSHGSVSGRAGRQAEVARHDSSSQTVRTPGELSTSANEPAIEITLRQAWGPDVVSELETGRLVSRANRFRQATIWPPSCGHRFDSKTTFRRSTSCCLSQTGEFSPAIFGLELFAIMDPTETFTLLPLSIDPQTKAISSTDAALAGEMEELNKMHRAFISLDTPNQIPPPPAPVNPKRSVQITKLKDSGNASYKKGQYAEALKMYDLAIRMASDRPPWEASGLVREELSTLYGNRAQSYMAQQAWAEAAVDAETAVEMKKVGNVKAWWRRGQCLKEMGRLGEANEWVKVGLEFERAGPERQAVGELEQLSREIEKALEKS